MRIRQVVVERAIRQRGLNADAMTPEWKSVLLADPCVYCHGRSTQMEHIIPRAYGGRNGWTNIAPACEACNLLKASGPLWWMLWRLNERRLGFTRQRVFRFLKGVPVEFVTDYTRLQRKKQHERRERNRTFGAVGLSVGSALPTTRA